MGIKLYSILFAGVFLSSCSGSVEEVKAHTAADPGQVFYEERCIQCHGVAGDDRLAGAADLKASTLSDDSIRLIIQNGKNGMPPFKSWIESDSVLNETVNYVKSLRK